MSSYFSICFILLLLSTCVVNIEPEDNNCNRISSNRLIRYLDRSEYNKWFYDYEATVLKCKFKLANMYFYADVVYASSTDNPRKIRNTLQPILASKMKVKVSPKSLKTLHLLTQTDLSTETRNAYIRLLLSSALQEPLKLKSFPKVKLILVDITNIEPVKKVEKKVESYNIKLNCKNAVDLLKLVTFETPSDYMKFVKDGIARVSFKSLIASNFSLSNCKLWKDEFVVDRSNDTQKDTTIEQKLAEIELLQQKLKKLLNDTLENQTSV